MLQSSSIKCFKFIVQLIAIKLLNIKLYLSRPTDVTKGAFDLRVSEWIDEAEEVLKIIQYGARVAYQEGLINQNKDTRQKRFFMSGNAVYLMLYVRCRIILIL